MTAIISHIFLQHYWWLIISILAGALVFLMFVQGGQSMIFSLPGSDSQKSVIVNALGGNGNLHLQHLLRLGEPFLHHFPCFIQPVSEEHTGFGLLFSSALSSRQWHMSTDRSQQIFMDDGPSIYSCLLMDPWDHFLSAQPLQPSLQVPHSV